MSTHSDAIRDEQIKAARRTLSIVPGSSIRQSRSGQRAPAAPKTSSLKGHEAFLKALELSKATVRVEKVSSGEVIIGTVKHSDKFTVTIHAPLSSGGEKFDRVLFKHDISEFVALTPKSEAV